MVVAKPTNDELREKIRELVPRVDLDTMGVKAFVKLLSKEFEDVDLKPRKDFIKQALSEVINEQTAAKNEEEEDEESEADEEESSSEDEDEPVARSPAAKKKRGKSAKRSGGGGGGGLAEVKEISDKLAAFLGQGKMMSRTSIVKQLWEYIRENELQNPSNRREIILDEAMRRVFDCERFTMFTMNKYVSAHVHPFKPVDLTTPSKASAAKKRKAKGKTGSSSKKKRKAGTQPPYRLSEDLQAIVGTDILPRPQVVSKIWEYIKANNLQNENDKREILCDDKLQRIMKTRKITMFQMNVHIGEHLIEKLDRSQYQHEAAANSFSDGDDSD